MKKLLGSTLALAMFLPAGANAEVLKNFKVSGSLDVQTTSARNVVDFVTREKPSVGGAAPGNANDRIGAATTRLILSGMWDLLDDVHGKVTLVKGASNQAASARPYGSGAENVNAVQTGTFVQEANVKIDKLFGALDTTAGRQFYGEAGDLIVYYGPRDNYGLRVDALDAFRADWSNEHMNVTAVAGKTAGGAATPAPADTDLRGIVVSCSKHEMVKPSVYVYNQVTHSVGALGFSPTLTSGGTLGKNSNLYVAGVKAKVISGGLTASGEFAKNFGEDRGTYVGEPTNFKGYAVQAKVSYKVDLDNQGVFTPWGEYGLGTGDSNFAYQGNNTFTAINSDYRPGGIYGRFDIGAATSLGSVAGLGFAGASNGLSNRVIWGIGVKATPSAVNKLTAGVQYYRYAFHRVAPNAGGVKTSRNIGSEVDVTGEWKHSENVSLKATAGSFLPGAYVNDLRQGTQNGTNPAVMLAGDVSIKF